MAMKWFTGSTALVTGAELVNRQIIATPNERTRYGELEKQLRRRAGEIYPQIPLVPFSTGRADEFARLQPKTVITGYNEHEEPITLGLLNPEELIEALGYSDSYLDYITMTGVDREGNVTTHKPDGTRWTLRERIYERPDIYNEALRGKINRENGEKSAKWVKEQLQQTFPTKPGEWTLRDTGQVMAMAAVWGIGKIIARRIEGTSEQKQLNDLISRMQYIPGATTELLETYIKPHLQLLIGAFKYYVFKGIRIPKDRKKITVYSIGCGNRYEGIFEAFAMHFLAQRLGMKVEVIVIDNDQEALDRSHKEWGLLAKEGLVEEKVVQFQRGDGTSVDFSKLNKANPLVVIMRNAEPLIDSQSVRQVAGNVIPIMEAVHSSGADARLLVSSGNKGLLEELKLRVLPDSIEDSSLTFLHDADNNLHTTPDTVEREGYITVIGFKN